MITSQEDFENAKSRALIIMECDYCNKEFNRPKNRIQAKVKRNINAYCSNSCAWASKSYKIETKCPVCLSQVSRVESQFNRNKFKSAFCSHKCAGIYAASHRTTGTNISKLEKWIQLKLIKIYPNLNFEFNLTNTINAELDIYIPSLKLAFELNGIFHYEPIFGKDKLEKTQNNDKRKFQACLEGGIELCVIDSSPFKYFKESGAIKYLNIITEIINKKLNTFVSN